MAIKLIYSSPEIDANLLYWSKVLISDSILAFEVNGRRFAIVNELEYPRLKALSGFDQIFRLDDFGGTTNGKVADFIPLILEKFGETELALPGNFPTSLALDFQRREIPFRLESGHFVPERLLKSQVEKNEIKLACSAISRAFSRVEEILRQSIISEDGKLYFSEKLLTSDYLRSEIEMVCFEHRALAVETIVACGKQSAEPHNRGDGPIFAKQFIVVDIFPYLLRSRYFGDMTRTFFKGEPSLAQKKMYNVVKEVHDRAIQSVKPGVDAKDIHSNIVEQFKALGFESGRDFGFFHSTGHGVGLELHERPWIGPRSEILREDMVFTVEPGLYYRDLGGVRIEDVIAVTHDGFELLSNFSYNWIL